MRYLSKNFTLEELIDSQTAREYGANEQWYPPEEVIKNLTALCVNLLQPLRDALGGSIHISSGWRCDWLNTKVGGVKDSQHRTGEAADCEYYGEGGNQAIIDKVLGLNLPFDQMIDEKNLAWIHLSFSVKSGNRRQVLKI